VKAPVLLYRTTNENVSVEVTFFNDNFWLTQKAMALLFDCSVDNISLHLKNIFTTGELNQNSVIEDFSTTAADGKSYKTKCYNLDAIIAVGYRVNSSKATQFRIWATQTLKEFIIKGFVLNDEMLKNGNSFGKDYFEELLEKIREIRISERRFYQKISDIFALSADYDKNASQTKVFFAAIQNKLHWAISGKTAAEIIYSEADATKIYMGLTTWKEAPDGKILKSDVSIAKNYLNKEHIAELNRLVSAFLDLAENNAKRQSLINMDDWTIFMDNFLKLSNYPIVLDNGKITQLEAKIKAEMEYEKFRIIQDQNYSSDFDKQIKKLE